MRIFVLLMPHDPGAARGPIDGGVWLQSVRLLEVVIGSFDSSRGDSTTVATMDTGGKWRWIRTFRRGGDPGKSSAVVDDQEFEIVYNRSCSVSAQST